LRQILIYTSDKFIEVVHKGAIIYNIDITRWLCKRNDKKTYQISKHHMNGLEDLSSHITLYSEKLPNL